MVTDHTAMSAPKPAGHEPGMAIHPPGKDTEAEKDPGGPPGFLRVSEAAVSPRSTVGAPRRRRFFFDQAPGAPQPRRGPRRPDSAVTSPADARLGLPP